MKKRAVRIRNGAAEGMEAVTSANSLWSNSSAILGATLLVDLEDINAVVRTAVLLARSRRSSLSVELLGKQAVQIASGEEVLPASLKAVLESIESQLRAHVLAKAQVFVLEASITAASFLSAGVISVRIRDTVPPPRRPIIAK